MKIRIFEEFGLERRHLVTRFQSPHKS